MAPRKTAKRSSSRSPSRGSSPRKSSVSLSSTSLLRSSSPASTKTTAVKRKIACRVGENGKIACTTVDKNVLPMSDAAKAIVAKKQENCAKLQDNGFGVCDAEGNFWGYQDDVPHGYTEEMDENGNIVRQIIIEPRYILVLEEKGAIENYKALMTLKERETAVEKFINASELRMVNPDKLKTVYMASKEEIINRNKLMRYLVCLASDDEEGASASRFGFVGTSIASLARNMLKYQFITKVFQFVGQQNVRDALKARGAVSTFRETKLSSDMTLIQGDDLVFEKIKWNYDGFNSVSVKIPEQMAAKIGEKLAFNELNSIIDASKSGEVDVDRFKVWIKRLVQNGTLIGSELSGTLVAMLITQAGLDAADIGLTAEYCAPFLNDSRLSKQINVTAKDGKITSVTAGKGDDFKRNVGIATLMAGNPRTGITDTTKQAELDNLVLVLKTARTTLENAEKAGGAGGAGGTGTSAIPVDQAKKELDKAREDLAKFLDTGKTPSPSL